LGFGYGHIEFGFLWGFFGCSALWGGLFACAALVCLVFCLPMAVGFA